MTRSTGNTSSTDSTTRHRPEPTPTPTAGRNTPARISFWAAACGLGLIAAIFLTPLFWIGFGGYYTFAMAAFGVVAVPAGHLGRRRAKRLGGRDRGAALFGILTGWLLILTALLIVVAYAGLIAGVAVLVDSAA
ncbi:DUF4190 domain-containing protein [Streptomyces katrae]|uniref:DUF4190 domain-containing protein n=1 Tax=Streptomyces katrae TaxID=68223 RepID=A0ABT7GVU1_9ACTN|nr:DUF4190 domain-containing protein [Streptomyces katrae]MDK9497722.1 DUF4190 domain-containing protein [Streptomyces katrae]